MTNKTSNANKILVEINRKSDSGGFSWFWITLSAGKYKVLQKKFQEGILFVSRKWMEFSKTI